MAKLEGVVKKNPDKVLVQLLGITLDSESRLGTPKVKILSYNFTRCRKIIFLSERRHTVSVQNFEIHVITSGFYNFPSIITLIK